MNYYQHESRQILDALTKTDGELTSPTHGHQHHDSRVRSGRPVAKREDLDEAIETSKKAAKAAGAMIEVLDALN